jgi:hypothetical protein
MNTMERPSLEEVPAFYHGYLAAADGTDHVEAISKASARFAGVMQAVPEGLEELRYAPGKWSIKEVVQHVIDSERIFTYRALRFARHDDTALPGFEENDYAAHCEADRRPWKDLVQEFQDVSRSTAALVRSFTPDMLLRGGKANGSFITVRGLAWIIAGHVEHHCNVIEQRYLTHG